MRLMQGQVEDDPVVKFEGYDFASALPGAEPVQPPVEANSVLKVYEVIAFGQFRKIEEFVDLLGLGDFASFSRCESLAGAGENFGIGDKYDSFGWVLDAGRWVLGWMLATGLLGAGRWVLGA